MTSLSPFPLALIVVLGLAAPVATPPAAAQSPTQKPPARPAPSTAKPSTAKPSTAKPSTAKPPTAKPGAPETAKAPTPPPPPDVRFKSIYTAGDMKTESVTYIKGERERYEVQDMVLLHRQSAAAKGLETREAIEAGLREKSAEFGGEIYVKRP